MSQITVEAPPVGEWSRRRADQAAYVEREVIKLERVARGSMQMDARSHEGALRRFVRRVTGWAL